MASKIAWSLIPRATIVAEAVQLAIALACLALGWITFPMLYALTGVELVLVVAISGAIYREKSLAVMAWDALKSLLLWGFCGLFVLGAYYAARGFADGLRIEPRALGVLGGIALIRLGWAALDANTSRDPRLQWTREVAMRGAVLGLSMFFACFACFLPGVLIANGLKPYAPAVAADVGLGFSLLACQAFLALIVATMTPEELAAVSRNPYNAR